MTAFAAAVREAAEQKQLSRRVDALVWPRVGPMRRLVEIQQYALADRVSIDASFLPTMDIRAAVRDVLHDTAVQHIRAKMRHDSLERAHGHTF